jgi:hypothetical protein
VHRDARRTAPGDAPSSSVTPRSGLSLLSRFDNERPGATAAWTRTLPRFSSLGPRNHIAKVRRGVPEPRLPHPNSPRFLRDILATEHSSACSAAGASVDLCFAMSVASNSNLRVRRQAGDCIQDRTPGRPPCAPRDRFPGERSSGSRWRLVVARFRVRPEGGVRIEACDGLRWPRGARRRDKRRLPLSRRPSHLTSRVSASPDFCSWSPSARSGTRYPTAPAATKQQPCGSGIEPTFTLEIAAIARIVLANAVGADRGFVHRDGRRVRPAPVIRLG